MEEKIATEEAVLNTSTSQNETVTETEQESNATFFDPKKSETSGSDFQISYPSGFPQTVNIDELEIHPINRSIYPYMDEDRILNVKSLEVFVVELDPDLESEFIISSNNHREKSIFDQRNEVTILWEKYSPGQGNRDDGDEKKERRNTVKKISRITGYSTSKISNIRRIDSTYPDFFEEIHKGNMTLNKAFNKCDVIDALENLDVKIAELEIDNIDDKLKSSMLSICESNYPQYYQMLKNGKMGVMDAYKKIFGKKKRVTNKDGDSNTNQGSNGELNDATYCPCCSHKVETKEDVKWIKEYRQQIHQFVVQLKF
jgi:hypothetical protein